MAPEQFHGKAVFASDVYSIGVTMYQMLTGVLPYATPAPADLERLERGELVSSPRLRNPKVPEAIADIVLKALAPALSDRYARASDVLHDVLAARVAGPKRVARAALQRRRQGRRHGRRHPVPAARARRLARAAVLLALPQAAARPGRQVPVLRRSPVGATLTACFGRASRSGPY